MRALTRQYKHQFEMPSFTHPKDMMEPKKIKNGSYDSNHTHFMVTCYPETNS